MSVDFHGVRLNVDVHNSYKAKIFGDKHDINIAAERTVKLKESGIECSISQYRIDIRMGTVKKKGKRPDYANFAFELKKKDLNRDSTRLIYKYADNMLSS